MTESSSHRSGVRIALYVTCAVIPLVVVIVVPNATHGGAHQDGINVAEPSTAPAIVPPASSALVPSTSAPATVAPAAQPAIAKAPAPAHNVLPTTSPADPEYLGQTLALSVESAFSRNSFRCSAVVGGAFGQLPFQDVAPDGVLIGFRIGMGKFFDKDTIEFFQPIYLTSSDERLGRRYGNHTGKTHRVTGPPGYAVGAATIRGGGGLDAITLTFMRIKETRLDPHDAYITDRLGGPGGSEAYLGGDGTPIIGICGKSNDKGEWLGLGLVFLKSTPTMKPH